MRCMDWMEGIALESHIGDLTIKKGTSDNKELRALIDESVKDPFLGDIAKRRKITDIKVLYVNSEAVGFAIPRKDSDGRYRAGAIYITPSKRKRGYMSLFLREYFKDKKGRAYIEPTNKASIGLFTSLGFKPSDKQLVSDGDVFNEYLKD